ncbi:MAG: UDP-glucose 4-epimerase GalE [Actinomycetaceae bacterium]|nr:UDP-glucose 4-epimerase GalE [Actinomycetaceae bacterium]
MSWLITGGAGYIGSHVVRAFARAGLSPVVIDDLSTGHASFVPDSVPFVRADIRDTALVQRTLHDYACDGVVHIAGFKYAGVSVTEPLHTYDQNVQATVSVLRAMHQEGVHRYVFSSSASVYGTPDVDLVTEGTALHPESPYGQTKLIGEWLNADMYAVDELWQGVNLRYFNVVGSGDPTLWDSSPHNLFPMVFDRLLGGGIPQVNGNDYPTPDGTCVRDYVHVADIASGHVLAAQAMLAGRDLLPAYNLGSGGGTSVQEIMDAIREVTGIDFTPIQAPRRAGDPARIVADGTAAQRDLGWTRQYDLQEMVRSAWESRQNASA